MDERTVYRILESRMLDYKDYKDKPVALVDEPLVPIIGSLALQASYIREDALPITGSQTYVRQGVLNRLVDAADILKTDYPGMILDVGYGYRALSVQTARFEAVKEQLAGDYSGEELIMAAHRKVAVPSVAGHPAGAAVDISMVRQNEVLDFGTNMWQFVRESYTNAPNISGEARKNRWILRKVMLKAGFAPFDGEWWHFSYGDKEWAAYYSKPAALYDQLEFRATDDTDV